MKDENRRLVERIFQDAQFIRLLGIELTSYGKGWCETRMNGSSSLRQQHGLIHGGALMTLADHTCGGAAASTVPEDREVITVENKITFCVPLRVQICFVALKCCARGGIWSSLKRWSWLQVRRVGSWSPSHPVPSRSFLLT
jgi:uncharacterized protein (TIGR00369 family)